MKKYFALLLVSLMLCAGVANGQLLTTLYEINQGDVPENTIVRVENIVVTAVVYNGFWAQETGSGPYSGIWVYNGIAPGVIIGDLVSIEGEYIEYYGLSEIMIDSGVLEVVGAGSVPDPILVRAVDVKTTNPDAERYEGVLVKLEHLNPLDLDPGYGEWFAEEYDFAVNDTLRLDDQFDYGQPSPGQLLLSVTGVLRYNYDEFKLEPRGNYDLVYDGFAPAPNIDWAAAVGTDAIDVKFDRDVEILTAENPFNYFLDIGVVATAVRDLDDLNTVHLTLDAEMTPGVQLNLTIFDVQNTDGIPMTPQDAQFWGGINSVIWAQQTDAGGDSSHVMGDIATITGVVHSKYSPNGMFHVFLQTITDEGDGNFNGMEVYMPGLIDETEIGDILIIADTIGEYYAQTSVTEPFYYFENVSSGNPVSAPDEMTLNGTSYEPFESAEVQVSEVVVVERGGFWNYYDWSVTQDGLNWLKVAGDPAYDEDKFYDYQSSLGDTLNIRGTIRYLYGEYVLMPRSDDDIDILYANPVAVEEGDYARLSLGQNFPNPFNPMTKIAFNLATAGDVSLEIFDVQGRLVKTLVSGHMTAEEHNATWHGDTDDGQQAVSGLYFYRLVTEREVITRRMMLLK
jgi:hypothetical protein